MKECKILCCCPEEHKIKMLEDGSELCDFPALEAELNRYLQDGWQIVSMNNSGTYFLLVR